MPKGPYFLALVARHVTGNHTLSARVMCSTLLGILFQPLSFFTTYYCQNFVNLLVLHLLQMTLDFRVMRWADSWPGNSQQNEKSNKQEKDNYQGSRAKGSEIALKSKAGCLRAY